MGVLRVVWCGQTGARNQHAVLLAAPGGPYPELRSLGHGRGDHQSVECSLLQLDQWGRPHVLCKRLRVSPNGSILRIWPEARLAQPAERKALNLVFVGSSPTVGVFIPVWPAAGLQSGAAPGLWVCSKLACLLSLPGRA